MAVKHQDIELLDAEMVAVLRQRSGYERVQSTFDMMEFGRDMVLEAVRQQHPQWPDDQVRREAMRRLFGDAI